MIQTEFTHGAQYLLFDEPLKLIREPITQNGFTIYPGDKVIKIGNKTRTMFEMNDGFYMEFEGHLLSGGNKIAIFNCPEHNAGLQQTNLFDLPVQYRYAFNIIEVEGKFCGFVSGSHKGCRDIIMDDLKIVGNVVDNPALLKK